MLRRFGRAVFVLLAVWVAGCSEDNTVAPPSPPHQIALQRITGMASDDVYDAFVDSQSRLWISTEAGVYLFPSSQGPFPDPSASGSSVQWFTDRDGLPNLRCRGLGELNGKIFAGTWGGGIGIFSGAVPWEAVRPADGLAGGRVFSVARDDTSMWIATLEGVSQYIDNGAPHILDRLVDHTPVFGDDKFTSIVVLTGVGGQPDSGEVWVSQQVGDSVGVPLPGGIKYMGLPTRHFQYFSTETSAIPTDNVLQVAYDPIRKLIWSVHTGTGVATLDLEKKTWRTYSTSDGLVSALTSSVAINSLGTKWPAGTVWIATQAGITKMAPDGTTVNYISGSGLPSLRIRRVIVDRNDDVWLCFVGVGAAKVTPPPK